MKIRIGQYAFAVGTRYAAGDTLTANEADALNGLRAENIRNNVKKLVDRATAALSPGQLLTPAELSELQDAVSAYARDYSFGERREPKGGIRQTPFEQELRAVASERVEAQQRQLGVELSAEGFEASVEANCKLAPVIEEARQRVAARSAIASKALEELL